MSNTNDSVPLETMSPLLCVQHGRNKEIQTPSLYGLMVRKGRLMCKSIIINTITEIQKILDYLVEENK